jgi:hypothetical protein
MRNSEAYLKSYKSVKLSYKPTTYIAVNCLHAEYQQLKPFIAKIGVIVVINKQWSVKIRTVKKCIQLSKIDFYVVINQITTYLFEKLCNLNETTC